MPEFADLLKDQKGLARAIKTIQLKASEKQHGDLAQLYATKAGIPAHRDKGNRVRGDTVHSCSMIGAYLTAHFDGVGPRDTMMWIGTVKIDRKGAESWHMRPEMRAALAALGWG